MRKLCIRYTNRVSGEKKSFQASGSSIHHEDPKKGRRYKFNFQHKVAQPVKVGRVVKHRMK
jgi:hypothetical protein